MEKKTIIFVYISAIALISAIGIIAACGGFGMKNFGFGGFPYGNSTNSTFNSQIQDAIKNNDFNTWKLLIENQLTQDNFNKLVAEYQNRSQIMNNTKEKWNMPMEDFENFTGNFNFTHPENFTGNFSHMGRPGMMKHGFWR